MFITRTLDRIAARALEAKKVVDAMEGWLNELEGSHIGAVTSKSRPIPIGEVSKGAGMTEELTREDIENGQGVCLSLHDIDLPYVFNVADLLGHRINPKIMVLNPKT